MLRKIIRIMEVDDSLLMSLCYIIGDKETTGDILADFTCHVVTLNADDGRVLVGILLLNLLVVALDQRENAVVGGVRLADERTVVAVAYVASCELKRALGHELILNHVLDLLYGNSALDLVALVLHVVCYVGDLLLGEERTVGGIVRLANGVDDFFDVERLFGAVTLDNFHELPFLFFLLISNLS
jgi:hypothetical protein